MKEYKILNFKYFPKIIGKYISIDKNTLIFKSYNSYYGYESIGNRVSYFGEIHNLINNLTFGKRIGCFSTKKKIKLLDIRYISKIINNLVLDKNGNHEIIMKGYNKIALSYGLIPLHNQLILYKNKYYHDLYNYYKYQKMLEYYQKSVKNNYYNNEGIRIGEVNNDVESTFILQEIFQSYCDGFIIPRMFSPYFTNNYIENELLLFNPYNCLVEMKYIPNNLKKNNLSYQLYNEDYNLKNNVDYIFKKNNLIDKYYKEHEKITNLSEIGYEFRKRLIL